MIVELDREKVAKLFEDNTEQVDVLIKLYKMVFPQWDQIKEVGGWPTITKATNEKIMGMFRTFDRKHHPEVISGGRWLNNGFSSLCVSEELKDWQADTETCEVVLKTN